MKVIIFLLKQRGIKTTVWSFWRLLWAVVLLTEIAQIGKAEQKTCLSRCEGNRLGPKTAVTIWHHYPECIVTMATYKWKDLFPILWKIKTPQVLSYHIYIVDDNVNLIKPTLYYTLFTYYTFHMLVLCRIQNRRKCASSDLNWENLQELLKMTEWSNRAKILKIKRL